MLTFCFVALVACLVLVILSALDGHGRVVAASQEERRELRLLRRAARRQALAHWRAGHPLLVRGDLWRLAGLVALAASVIALCR